MSEMSEYEETYREIPPTGVKMQILEERLLNKAAEKARNIQQNWGDRIRDEITTAIYRHAEKISGDVVSAGKEKTSNRNKIIEIDDIVTSRALGFPLMLFLLCFIFWLTIYGANYPSDLLSGLFSHLENLLSRFFSLLNSPEWLHDLIVLGIFRSLVWVVSVMLPPMAIFFPLFTLLEDLGYLPRVAFNLDKLFKLAGAHGKQALTMAMGFGCNAAGIISTRIIESPRERMIAILTNNYVPCNGRFPLLLAVSSLLMGAGIALSPGSLGSLSAAGLVVLLVVFSIMVSLFVSWTLSKTLLKGVPSSFTLELPPYRKPQVLQVLIRSIFDRTIFVLFRAIIVAAPAGAIIWIAANVSIGGESILHHVAAWLNPFGSAIGLDGYILLAFILGLPANEIVIPILMMSYLSTGTMLEISSLNAVKELLIEQGWTWVTALNMMLFSLLHFPCGTTLLTIFKETGSYKWTAAAALITTFSALLTCFLVYRCAMLMNVL